MAGWGMTLVIFGLGSFLLNRIGAEFILLMWVDYWGPSVGMAIRLGVAAVGVVMMVVPRFLNTRKGSQ